MAFPFRKRKLSNFAGPVKRYRAVAPRVRTVSSAERKGVVFNLTSTTIPSGGLVTLINGIGTGSDIDTRDGRQVNLKSMTGQLYVFPGATAAGSAALHFYIIRDKAPNGSLPAFTDIFDTNSVPHVPRQDAKHRFTIVRSIPRSIGYDGTATVTYNNNSPMYIDMGKPLSGRMFFKGVTSGIASIDTGALYFVAIGSNANYTMQLKTLVEFTDY